MGKNKTIISIILLFLLTIKVIYAVDIIISIPDSKQTVSIDSFEEGGKVYIHLPSLILKINGTISVQDNIIKLSVKEKNINIDFQNNLASINDPSTTKLVQFQNQIKLWQDTIWVEMDDARILLQNMINGNLDLIENLPESGEENKVKQINQDEDKRNLDTEIPEQNLLEKITPVQENLIEEKEKIITLNKILIIPGHGGEENGIAFSSDRYEKDVTLQFAVNLEKRMKKNNVNTIITRRKDELIDIKEICDSISKEKVDFFINIHTAPPRKEGGGLNIFVSKFTNDSINSRNISLVDETITAIKEKYKNMEIKKYICPLIFSDCTGIPGILIEFFPQYTDDLKGEKWEILLDEKSDIYSIIVEQVSKFKNSI